MGNGRKASHLWKDCIDPKSDAEYYTQSSLATHSLSLLGPGFTTSSSWVNTDFRFCSSALHARRHAMCDYKEIDLAYQAKGGY